MFNDIIKKKLSQAMKITFEIEPEEKDKKSKEDEELKKEGLAPSNPKKDDEVKGKKMEIEAEVPMDDDLEVAQSLMPEDEIDELASMPGKAKGLFGKMKQGVAKNIAKKDKSLEA